MFFQLLMHRDGIFTIGIPKSTHPDERKRHVSQWSQVARSSNTTLTRNHGDQIVPVESHKPVEGWSGDPGIPQSEGMGFEPQHQARYTLGNEGSDTDGV